MQITLDLPDSLTQTDTFNQSDWLREIAIALFQQERITLSRASKIAGIDLMEFQKLIADRGICVHYDVEDFEQDVQHLRDRGWLCSSSATLLPSAILP
jgi:predicted HTH domain antitoxin